MSFETGEEKKKVDSFHAGFKVNSLQNYWGEPRDYLEMSSSAVEMFQSWLLRAFGDHLFITDMMLWAALARSTMNIY